jgi:hypothetical protein
MWQSRVVYTQDLSGLEIPVNRATHSPEPGSNSYRHFEFATFFRGPRDHSRCTIAAAQVQSWDSLKKGNDVYPKQGSINFAWTHRHSIQDTEPAYAPQSTDCR